MAVSIKDIARVAGVSHSTVSRALSGSSLIPDATASKIKTIAAKMGYTASAIGRGLVQGRTEAIGVVVTSISDPFNGEVVEGLEEVANSRGYSVILATSQGQPDREISVVKSFQSRRVDGIIVASSRVGSNYSTLLAGLDIPVVLLNNQHPDEFSYSVRIDNKTGTFIATRHLLELGHTKIAYLGDETGVHSDADRRSGFLTAMHDANLPVAVEFFLNGNGKLDRAVQISLDFLAHREHRPTAFVCYNDMSAIGLMQAAKKLGISVPDQLSVVGFDDILAAEIISPGLTTIRQPKRQLGMRAMSSMLQLLRGEEAEKSVLLPGELVVRQSTSKKN